MIKKRISLWLVPAQRDKVVIEKIISELSHRYKAPFFEPHITVYTGDLTIEEVKSTLNLAVNKLNNLTIDIDKILFRNEFTKTLFLTFKFSRALELLFNSINKSIEARSDYILDPHMSLIYKDIPKVEKAKICKRISLPLARISFDEIKAIHTLRPTKTAEDVKNWQTVYAVRT